ncbi:MAG: protoporphyrinogen oxidase [Burkholderiales bacterium]
MNSDTDVLVVGAGISGLTTAYLLRQHGFRVELIDAAPCAGGVIATEKRDGLLYERGPNSILDTHPCIGGLLEKLGIAGERIDTRPVASRRYVVRNGCLMALPTSPPAFLKTRLFSVKGKLRLAREPFVRPAPAGAEESVTQFVSRRLGRELLDYAIEPFVAGVYAGNPDELSLAAAFPKLHALEQRYGSLIKGQIKGARERARRSDHAKNVARSFSFQRGMQTLTDALAESAGPIQVSSRARTIEREQQSRLTAQLESGGEFNRIDARAVVLAVPADAAADLLRAHLPDAAQALESIVYAPVASVVCAYRRADVSHPLDGFGFLVPRVEQRSILGSLFSSSMFEGRAPDGVALLTTFVGGRRNPSFALEREDLIIARVVDELRDLVGAGDPIATAVTRWPRAIPQYTLGHPDRVRRAEQSEHALPGLFLCASYRGGVSVGDCIKSAHETADKVSRYLLQQ